MAWTSDDIPNQDGRVAVVTGANGGLGLATAKALAGKGAHVVMAARNQQKAAAARDEILDVHPNASLELVELDLASLASIERAAKHIVAAHDRVDMTILNAGLMALPEQQTEDGFEMQFGVNHLGHWALTSHLLPTIVRTPGARVVTVTSTGQHGGRRINPDNPHMRGNYKPWRMYADTKLANRHFAVGLHQQFTEHGVDAKALTAHPGLTHSDLQHRTVREGTKGSGYFWEWLSKNTGMSIDRGALSQLRAATDPDAPGGGMYGPLWMQSGPPVAKPLVRPGSAKAIRILWDVSRRETGLDVDVAQALADS
ncbi:MAG: oxidoreductase [Nitriliruptorales bacterium]|nr:oxidoreductase [Nitriliruptorales bacterium]